MLKKITMLAMAVAALAAFAIPASASAALDWTDNGTVVKENVDLTETYEGFLKFSISETSSFGCQVTVTLTVKGPTRGEITGFNPTTSTCAGTGVLAGCELKADSNNAPWTVTNGASTLAITKSEGNITIFNEYVTGSCPALGASSDLLFPSITATPAYVGGGTSGVVTSLSIVGVSTVGAVASGTVHAEKESPTLGLK